MRNCIHPSSPHNNGEHEDTNEDNGAVGDDDNHDREQTVGWQKRVQTLERFLCELFQCSELEDVFNNSHKAIRIFNALSFQYRAKTYKFEVFVLMFEECPLPQIPKTPHH